MTDIARVLVIALTDEHYKASVERSPILKSLPTEWSPGVDLRNATPEDIKSKYPEAFLNSTLWRTTLHDPPEPCIMTRTAELGCYLAHVQAWRRAQTILASEPSGSRVMIMEDDTQISEKTVAALAERDEDLIWFAHCFHGWSTHSPVLHNIPEGNRVTGMLAYAINTEAATSLLSSALPVAMHVDAWLSSHVASSELRVAIMNPRTKLVKHGARASLLQHELNYAMRLQMLSTVVLALILTCLTCAVYIWIVWRKRAIPAVLGLATAVAFVARFVAMRR